MSDQDDDFDEKEAILLEMRDFAIRIAQAGYPTLGSALAHLGACAAFNCEREAHAQLEALSKRGRSVHGRPAGAFVSVQDTQAERDRRLRLDLKRRLRLEGFEGDLSGIADLTALRQLLDRQVQPYAPGQPVEVQVPGILESWRVGTFARYVAARPAEGFRRMDVGWDCGGAFNLPPERVRRAL